MNSFFAPLSFVSVQQNDFFGPTNEPSKFQRELDIVLATYEWKKGLVQLNDIIIFYSDSKYNLKHVY